MKKLIYDPLLLVDAAKKAGIEMPDNPDLYQEYKELYPHWYTFCKMQLCKSMPDWGVHYENAQIIASVHEDAVLNVSKKIWLLKGFQIGKAKYINKI